MKRHYRSRHSQAPRYPTLHEGRKLLLAGLLGLSGCGITDPFEENVTNPPMTRDASQHQHPDAGDLAMGVAPGPGLDASVPEPGPDAGDLLMGDVAEPQLDAATPAAPDAGDLMMGGIAEPEDAGE